MSADDIEDASGNALRIISALQIAVDEVFMEEDF
jgi:hypothetical protein